MPYIKRANRALVTPTSHLPAQSEGELNFQITVLVNDFLAHRKAAAGKISYADFNAAIGVLEAAKLELYRRMVAPYEEEKRLQNGEVYDIH